MRTFKNNKELQANTHRFIDEDVKEKNARGKKTSWTSKKHSDKFKFCCISHNTSEKIYQKRRFDS